jgi:aminopeptidase N
MRAWHFHPTPPMPTYLLAVVVGHMASVTRTLPPAVTGGAQRTVSVWGTPDRCVGLRVVMARP